MVCAFKRFPLEPTMPQITPEALEAAARALH
jgi:hypothetical protein